MSTLWLLLQLLPLLLLTAALFYWLGLRQRNTHAQETLQHQKDLVDQAQQRADDLTHQLILAETQINTLTTAHEALQHTTVPRRLLSDAEGEILHLRKQLSFTPDPTPPDPKRKRR